MPCRRVQRQPIDDLPTKLNATEYQIDKHDVWLMFGDQAMRVLPLRMDDYFEVLIDEELTYKSVRAMSSSMTLPMAVRHGSDHRSGLVARRAVDGRMPVNCIKQKRHTMSSSITPVGRRRRPDGVVDPGSRTGCTREGSWRKFPSRRVKGSWRHHRRCA